MPLFSSIAQKTKFWSFTRKRFCVVCALNCARILVVRALDCAQFLLHPALFPTWLEHCISTFGATLPIPHPITKFNQLMNARPQPSNPPLCARAAGQNIYSQKKYAVTRDRIERRRNQSTAVPSQPCRVLDGSCMRLQFTYTIFDLISEPPIFFFFLIINNYFK